MLVKRLPVTELMDLWIGHQGEGNSRAVEIMIAPWVKEWPDAQVIVLYERPGESTLYAGNAALDGSVVKWVIDPFATEKPGAGRMILQAKQGDAVVKSAVAVTRVTPNLQGTATEPPTPPTGFVEQVLDAAERAEDAAKRAEAEAHPPIIGDGGTWLLWDNDAGEYVDSGLPSRGEPGKDGKTAYQYAQDGGYTGTEEEFAEKLAAEIPPPYTLPVATADTLGGVKVGKGLHMDGEAIGVTTDDTLEKPGEAADSAAVGKKVAALSEKITAMGLSVVNGMLCMTYNE